MIERFISKRTAASISVVTAFGIAQFEKSHEPSYAMPAPEAGMFIHEEPVPCEPDPVEAVRKVVKAKLKSRQFGKFPVINESTPLEDRVVGVESTATSFTEICAIPNEDSPQGYDTYTVELATEK
jgi:hypothetical protein